MGDWDDAIKVFLSNNAQALIELVYGKEYGRITVKRKLLTEFKVRTKVADSVLEFELEEDGEQGIFHLEIQSTFDPDIAERLLEYSLATAREHHLPVLSCVIYLRNVGEVPQPPLRWYFIAKKEVLWFDYLSVELAKIPLGEIKRTGLMNLLPLAVLTKGGTNRHVLQEVVTELTEAQQTDLLSITKLFAGLVFTGDEDKRWLERMFAMQNNPLAESWVYQEILQEGIEKGIEKGIEQGIEKGREEGKQEGKQEGLQEGLQEGKIEGLQQAVLSVVEARFPPLVGLARQRVTHARQPEAMNLVLRGVATAPNEEQARFVLELLVA